MKLLIGLGNPGKEYQNTRHNIGFIILEKLRQGLQCTDFGLENKFEAEISRGKQAEQDIILARPQTFMNASGQAIRKISGFYKLSPADVMVIHDDLDIPLGEFRLASDSSSAGHNGVQDIIDTLGTQQFARIRIGIGRPKDNSIDPKDYVLDQLSETDMAAVDKIFDSIKAAVAQFLIQK